MRGRIRVLGIVLVVAGLAGGTAPAARADDNPPNPHEGVSSIDQYIEDIPTASGPQASGRSTKPKKPTKEQPAAVTPPPAPPPAGPQPPVPPEPEPKPQLTPVERKIVAQGGKDAIELRKITTADRYGAPSQRLAAPRTVRQASVGSAVGDAVTGDDRSLLVALIGLVAVTLVAGVAAAFRARASRR
jgi:pyruvate/2-oxoglutarate dehydrogenase complex dihydrolipoamide acyltransferase (E2) component